MNSSSGIVGLWPNNLSRPTARCWSISSEAAARSPLSPGHNSGAGDHVQSYVSSGHNRRNGGAMTNDSFPRGDKELTPVVPWKDQIAEDSGSAPEPMAE